MRQTIDRREFIQRAGGGAAALLLGQSAVRAAQGARPNVLLLLSDQQHWRAVGFMEDFFDTPRLDALAREAFVFENMFCTTPQCSPSRSSLLSGLYPSKTGVYGNGGELKHRSIGALLQDAGYHTGYAGKWHLGNDPRGIAGWDKSRAQGGSLPNPVRNFDYSLPEAPGLDEWPLSNWGAGFIADAGKQRKPFALVLSYTNPHDVYHYRRHEADAKTLDAVPLPRSWREGKFDGKPAIHLEFMTADQGIVMHGQDAVEWKRYRDCYREKTKLFDDNVGLVLDEVKKRGLWDDTIVVITSDHGDMDAHHKLIYKGPFMYDQMMRVPLLIRVPEKLGGAPPRRVKDLDVVNVDIMPTLLELAGAAPPPCDGISLAPTLKGKPGQQTRPFVIGQYYKKQNWTNPIRMIRTKQYKYNRYLPEGEELYDLQRDPDELHNLAEDPKHAQAKRELAAKLDRWIEENDDPFYSLKAEGGPMGNTKAQTLGMPSLKKE